MSAPDPQLAIARYRAHAAGLRRLGRAHHGACAGAPWRGSRYSPGQTVLDVACGTGLSFPLLQ